MARIAALEAQNRQLTEHVVKLEEELALARLHRFAPRSEKHVDRLFNEAEQVVGKDDADREENDVVDLRTQGCRPVKAPRGRSVAAGRCQQTYRASASNMTFPTIKRLVLAVGARCIAWARSLPSNFISR